MGLGFLSWWLEGNKQAPSSPSPSPSLSPPLKSEDSTMEKAAEVPGMNGAVAVLRSPLIASADVSVIEFGSVSALDNKVTLAGYCPVNNDGIEPCRWEILPAANGEEAPQLRIVF